MGTSKALLSIDGVPLISRIVTILKPLFREVIIVSDSAAGFEFTNCKVIPDLFKEVGPLGGIHAALSYSPVDYVFVTSCDMPAITSVLIQYIADQKSNFQCSIPVHDGELQPLCGIYLKSVNPLLSQFLSSNRHKVQDFIRETGFKPIEISAALPFYTSSFFFNINRPTDLQVYLNSSRS